MAREGSLGVRRRASRLAAVQALYQIELAGKSVDEAIADLQQRRAAGSDDTTTPKNVDVELFVDIVRGVTAQRPRLDIAIDAALTKDRGIERIEVLLRLILRAGTYELMSRSDIDVALSINEYVAVAQAFFAGTEPGFVNGVLDRVARDVRGVATGVEADGEGTGER